MRTTALDYKELKDTAQSGDILFLSGTSFSAKFLRMFTASNYNHVALLLRGDAGTLWVCEMLGGSGYTSTPASQRVPAMCKQGVVSFGRMPCPNNKIAPHYEARKAMLKYRDGHPDTSRDPTYSYIGALFVWLAQWAKPLVPVKFKWLVPILEKYAETNIVCSTYAQAIWTTVGNEFTKPADPEDLSRMVPVQIQVNA